MECLTEAANIPHNSRMTRIDPGGRSGPIDGDGVEFGRGPVLVVESPGVLAGELAEMAHTQCGDRGVWSERHGIDDLSVSTLGGYTSVIVTLPDETTSRLGVTALGSVDQLVRAYRGDRRFGIAEILSGEKPWHLARVIQIAGDRMAFTHGLIRDLKPLVCKFHRLDPKSTPLEVDFFSIYRRPNVLPGLESQVDRNNASAWEYLATWGIHDPVTAMTAWRIFEECLRYYENPKFRDVYRPVKDIDLNRLGIMLFMPDTPAPQKTGDPVKDERNWQGSGARTGRYVLDQLAELDPGIRRPSSRAGQPDTRGQQDDLRGLYATLDTVIKTPEFRSANGHRADRD